MTEKKTLQDEELENVAGGGISEIPEGAIVFGVAPDYFGKSNCTCSNIAHNGLTDGKNNGRTCAHCNNVKSYKGEDGYFKTCCTQYASDFRKID